MRKFKLRNLVAIAVYTVLVAVVLISCGEKQTQTKEEEYKTIYDFGFHQHIRVYEVDSCEYIGFSGTSDGGTSIIHKQNCKFCVKRSKHNCN